MTPKSQPMIYDIYDATNGTDKWAKVTLKDGSELEVRGDCFTYADDDDGEEFEILLCDVRYGESRLIGDRDIVKLELPE